MTRTAVEPGSVGIGRQADEPNPITPVEHEGLCIELESAQPIYNRGPDYEPLMVEPGPLRIQAATFIRAQAAELERLRGALEEYDEAVSVCPIRANDQRAIAAERCPVCMATSSQGCGREASASYQFINTARALSDTPPDTGTGTEGGR